MNKWIALSLVSLMALPAAFATEQTPVDIIVDATSEDVESELSFEDSEFSHESLRPPRPGPRPPRPGPGPRPRPPRTAWICLARDLVRNGFRYVDYDLAWARHGALRECARHSPVGRCYLVACDRY